MSERHGETVPPAPDPDLDVLNRGRVAVGLRPLSAEDLRGRLVALAQPSGLVDAVLDVGRNIARIRDAIDERGPDGVSERWKQRFIPPDVRALCDQVLADRWPELDPLFAPAVDAVQTEHELSSLVFAESDGRKTLELTFRLGGLAAMLVLEPGDMADVEPLWPLKLAHALRALRGKRSTLLVEPKSVEQLAFELRLRAQRRTVP